MSYTTSVYTYTVRQVVVVLSGTSPRKYMPVYAKPLTLNKGVDNQLQFQFLNQEQKPVDLSSIATANQSISFRAIDSDGTGILLKKALTPVLDVNGIFVLNTTAAEIENINAQKCYYSLEWPSGNLNLPVFVDSQAGARGLWQFMYYTAKAEGLRIDSYIDERKDPRKSTEAACNHLNRLYRMYDDWFLALAAYNCGSGRVARASKLHQTYDFWQMHSLPRETRNYIPYFLAATIMAKQPEKFGLIYDAVP